MTSGCGMLIAVDFLIYLPWELWKNKLHRTFLENKK